MLFPAIFNFLLLVFVNPNVKAAVPFSGLSMGGRTFSASTKNFSSLQLLRFEDLPFLGDHEFIHADQ